MRDCVFTLIRAQRKLADLGHADFCGCACNMHLRWCNGPSVEAENSYSKNGAVRTTGCVDADLVCFRKNCSRTAPNKDLQRLVVCCQLCWRCFQPKLFSALQM